MKPAFILVVAAGLFGANSAIAGPIKTSCEASRSTRAMLKLDMTYAEVVATIGCEGVLVIAGQKKTYQWSAKGPVGSYLRVMFNFGDKMVGSGGFLPL